MLQANPLIQVYYNNNLKKLMYECFAFLYINLIAIILFILLSYKKKNEKSQLILSLIIKAGSIYRKLVIHRMFIAVCILIML